MNKGLSQLLGKEEISLEGIDFGGRTDPQIIRDILLVNGLNKTEAEHMLSEALGAYVKAYTETFQHDFVTALAGAVDLVKKLSEFEHIQLALLTGNVQSTAYLKVGAIGLDGYFPFGAFGDDYEDRGKLPGVAVERALEHNGNSYEQKNIVIIGDTKHDILCGRHLNVYSIAVSTGHYHSDDLSQYNPDVLLDDLSETDKVVEIIV